MSVMRESCELLYLLSLSPTTFCLLSPRKRFYIPIFRSAACSSRPQIEKSFVFTHSSKPGTLEYSARL